MQFGGDEGNSSENILNLLEEFALENGSFLVFKTSFWYLISNAIQKLTVGQREISRG